MRNATWIGGYWGEFSCENPKVPFCTAFGALLIRMTDLYLRKNIFFKALFFLCIHGLWPFLNLIIYLILLVIINYPRFIRRVNANQMTFFYMSLSFTVKGTSEQALIVQAFNFVGKTNREFPIFSPKLVDNHLM